MCRLKSSTLFWNNKYQNIWQRRESAGKRDKCMYGGRQRFRLWVHYRWAGNIRIMPAIPRVATREEGGRRDGLAWRDTTRTREKRSPSRFCAACADNCNEIQKSIQPLFLFCCCCCLCSPCVAAKFDWADLKPRAKLGSFWRRGEIDDGWEKQKKDESEKEKKRLFFLSLFLSVPKQEWWATRQTGRLIASEITMYADSAKRTPNGHIVDKDSRRSWYKRQTRTDSVLRINHVSQRKRQIV